MWGKWFKGRFRNAIWTHYRTMRCTRGPQCGIRERAHGADRGRAKTHEWTKLFRTAFTYHAVLWRLSYLTWECIHDLSNNSILVRECSSYPKLKKCVTEFINRMGFFGKQLKNEAYVYSGCISDEVLELFWHRKFSILSKATFSNTARHHTKTHVTTETTFDQGRRQLIIIYTSDSSQNPNTA